MFEKILLNRNAVPLKQDVDWLKNGNNDINNKLKDTNLEQLSNESK